MGRSVDYLSRALGVSYFTIDPTNENGKVIAIDENDEEYERDPTDDDWSWEFECLESNILSVLEDKYPSLSRPSKPYWDGNETKILLVNEHCEIGISEYCGLVSISIRVNENDYNIHPGISETWVEKVWPNMVKLMGENTGHTQLRKLGSFSNGEGVYEKVT